MKKLVLVAAVLLAAPVLAKGKAPSTADTKALSDGVQTLLNQVADGFNKADANAVASAFADDATLINPAGMVGHGKAEVTKVAATDLATILKGTTSTFTVESVRKVGNDAVWFDASHQVEHAKGPDGKETTMKLHLTGLALKKGGKWWVAEARPYAFVTPPPHAG